MWEHILNTALGGLEGFMRGRQYDDTQKMEREKLRVNEQIKLLEAELRARIAAGNNDARRDVATIAAGSRENVAETNQGGANYRHDTQSADNKATNDTRVTVTDKDNASAEKIAGGRDQTARDIAGMRTDYLYDELFADDATARRGQDIASGDRRFMHATPSGNAVLGANVDLRGQDIASSDRRYATDTGAATAREAETGRTTRARDVEAGRDRRHAQRYGGGAEQPATNVTAPTFAPTPVTPRSQSMSVAPIAAPPQSTVREPGTPPPAQEPVAPQPSATTPPPQAPDARSERSAQLAQTMAAAIQRLKTATTPAAKAAAAAEVQRIRQQVVDFQTKGQ